MRIALVLLLAACTKGDDTGEDLGPRGDCDPLTPEMCALPYPSNFFTRADDTTPTGLRVDFGPTSLPKNRDGVQIDPKYFNEKDGFATTGPLMTWFADVALDGVVGHQNIEDYALPDAKIVLVNTATGERVPVWAELDMTSPDEAQRLFYIWPAVPLDFATRYVVGIQHLRTTSGGELEASPGFRALREGATSEDPDVERQRDHFEADVFPALGTAGVTRADLQLAWDFTTVSRQTSLGRMDFIRDDGLQRLDGGIPYEILEVEDHDCTTEPIARDVKVRMTVPLYTELDSPNTVLTRDAAGMPFYNGDTEVDVLVRIPCSVATDPHPARVLQYGHGLLGDRTEAYTGWLSNFANEQGWIIVATDWTGMSTIDTPAIALAITQDPTDFAIVPERCHQGIFEAMAALRLITGDLANDDAMKYDGVSVVDPTKVSYYGNSQGGILGGAYLAASPDLDRGVLGVPGGPYALLLDRSHDFDPFFDLLKAKFLDHRDISFVIESFEMLWEPAESAGWVHDMGDKRVLLQDAIGDAQVTTLGAHYLARGYGATTVAPQTRPIYGIEEATGPLATGSAIVEFSYADVDPEPVENLPPNLDTDPHECPRREPAGHAQIAEFLIDGTITNHCDGACDDHLRTEICP